MISVKHYSVARFLASRRILPLLMFHSVHLLLSHWNLCLESRPRCLSNQFPAYFDSDLWVELFLSLIKSDWDIMNEHTVLFCKWALNLTICKTIDFGTDSSYYTCLLSCQPLLCKNTPYPAKIFENLGTLMTRWGTRHYIYKKSIIA